MRVALIAQPYDSFLPPRQNSIGLIAYNTAIEMSRQIDIMVCGKQNRGLKPPAGLPFKVSFVSDGADRALQYIACHYPRWAGRFGISATADAYAGYARSVAAELDRSDVELVHVMNYWAWCRRFKGAMARRRVVLEMQSEWLSQMNKKQVGRELEAVDAVVAVSEHIARLFRESFPAYHGEVITAYNGVNIADFQPASMQNCDGDEELPILFVGRVSPEKGIHTLIEAFAQLASQIPRARLIVAGPRASLREDFIVGISSDPLVRALSRFYSGSLGTDYQHYLDNLVRRSSLENKVRFLGHVPHNELPALYRSSKLVVNPSLSESFGISIVEGMACGLPVVGTKVGGMLETVVDNQTGLLIEPERPDLLAAALVRLLNDPNTAMRMGANGRARAVEHFSWRARAERLLSAYRAVLKNGT